MSREQNGARSFPHLSALRLTLRGRRPYRPPAIVCYLSPVCLNTHSLNGGHDLKKSFSLWAVAGRFPSDVNLRPMKAHRSKCNTPCDSYPLVVSCTLAFTLCPCVVPCFSSIEWRFSMKNGATFTVVCLLFRGMLF